MVVSLAVSIDNLSAGEVGVVVLSGVLIVFVVLAIIYCALAVMQSVFTKDKQAAALDVTAPIAGVIEQFVTRAGRVDADEVVLILSDAAGRRNEILAPTSGTLKAVASAGAAVKQGDVLFTIG